MEETTVYLYSFHLCSRKKMFWKNLFKLNESFHTIYTVFFFFFFNTYNVSQGFLHQKQTLFFPHDQFPPFFLTLYLGHLCSLCFDPCIQMYEFTTSSGLYLQRLIYRKIISSFRDLKVFCYIVFLGLTLTSAEVGQS